MGGEFIFFSQARKRAMTISIGTSALIVSRHRGHDNQRGDLLLIGLEAFIPPRAPAPSEHSVVDGGYRRVDAGGWYLARYPGGRYDLR
jgi:hypothetical protein